MELPIYRCVIDESLESELQVEFVSLVEQPAIERNFLAFKEQMRFTVDAEKRIVSGPAMLADMLIYRKDELFGEYYTMFDAPTILSIVQKFFKKGYVQNFNLMHDKDQATKGVTVFESFLVDAARGIMPMKGFEDAKDGSWFLSAKVDDETIWEKVKSGSIKGFSVEGIFQQLPVKMSRITPEAAVEKIKAIMAMVVEEKVN